MNSPFKKKKGRPWLNNLRWGAEFALVEGLTCLLSPLSAQTVYRMGCCLGGWLYALPGKRKRIAMTNLGIAFGNSLTRREKKRIYRESVTQVVISVLQCFWILRDTENRVHQLIPSKPEGLDILEGCLSRGKGVFFLTAHYGNWEVMGLDHGYRNVGRLNSIVRCLDNPKLEKTTCDLRTRSGNGIFYREESPLKIIRAIKNNQCVAVMMDQNSAKGGMFVDFFGQKAATARSIAALAYKTGAAIIPLFCYPQGDGTYKVEYGPELLPPISGDKKMDVIVWTQACQKFIESVITKQPEYWMWFHRRWKTRPPEETHRIY